MITDSKSPTEKSSPLKASGCLTETKGKDNIENLTRQLEQSGPKSDNVGVGSYGSDAKQECDEVALSEKDRTQHPEDENTPETEKAYIAAQQALQDTDKRGIYLKGVSSEASGLIAAGDGAIDLNTKAGANYPVYDIVSPDELSSVKTHWDDQYKPNIDAYVRDFNKMISGDTNRGRGYKIIDGDTIGSSPIEQAAQELMEVRDNKENPTPVPNALVGANREEIIRYIREETVLRVPDDHIEAVQNALEEKMIENPERYGLEGKPQEEIHGIVGKRVKGVGLKTEQLQELINRKNEQYSRT